MDQRQSDFLEAALGAPAAAALRKAIEREPALAPALVPRVALGWLRAASLVDFEGVVPGTDLAFELRKSQRGGFVGAVRMGGTPYAYDGAELTHVASAVAVSLGVSGASPAASGDRLGRLGASVDALARARAVQELRKCQRPGAVKFPKRKKRALKAEKPGQTAKPTPALAPSPPAAPEPAPAQVAARRMKVTKSQAERPCPSCGLAQFGGGALRGCACFRDLVEAGTVGVQKTESGWALSLRRPDWDDDSAAALLAALGPP
jgi:hypothetical protein